MVLDDSDEKENTAFELVKQLKLNGKNVHTIRLSSMTPDVIRFAVLHPGELNANVAASVSVRKELRLKIKIAFSRYLNMLVHNHFKERECTISYIPSQGKIQCFNKQSVSQGTSYYNVYVI